MEGASSHAALDRWWPLTIQSEAHDELARIPIVESPGGGRLSSHMIPHSRGETTDALAGARNRIPNDKTRTRTVGTQRKLPVSGGLRC
eukprot:2780865-Prymnesium_polylepis.1